MFPPVGVYPSQVIGQFMKQFIKPLFTVCDVIYHLIFDLETHILQHVHEK